MKRIAFLIFALFVGVSFADDLRTETLTVTFGTGVTNVASKLVATNSVIKGYIEEIMVVGSQATATGTFQVVYQPAIGDEINLATNVAADTTCLVFRPVVDKTDTAGAALTSDTPARYPVVGELIKFAVTNEYYPGGTSAVYKCVIKYNQRN